MVSLLRSQCLGKGDGRNTDEDDGEEEKKIKRRFLTLLVDLPSRPLWSKKSEQRMPKSQQSGIYFLCGNGWLTTERHDFLDCPAHPLQNEEEIRNQRSVTSTNWTTESWLWVFNLLSARVNLWWLHKILIFSATIWSIAFPLFFSWSPLFLQQP